jgi:hypothetical protein
MTEETIGGQRLLCGDCLDVLPRLPEDSVDLIATDPPYGIAFMGKQWDKSLPDPRVWRECLRVLKPGGSAVVMSGSRLDCLWRMCRDLEGAGFELEQTALFWCYRSGFPKGTDLSKAADARAEVPCPDCDGPVDFSVDVAEQERYLGDWKPCERCGGRGTIRGAEREVVGVGAHAQKRNGSSPGILDRSSTWTDAIPMDTAPATDLARDLDGWFTKGKVKPAVEVIIWARKPNSERTELDNMVRWGVGGVNCGACMVPWTDDGDKGDTTRFSSGTGGYLQANGQNMRPWIEKRIAAGEPVTRGGFAPAGRFPANLLVTDEALGTDDSRYFSVTAWAAEHGYSDDWAAAAGAGLLQVAKPSRGEKNAGCEGLPQRLCGTMDGGHVVSDGRTAPKTGKVLSTNHHPTCKPVTLFAYLIEFLTRPGAIVLDPFLGSGTTLVAAAATGREGIGIELNADYLEIAAARVRHAQPAQLALAAE